MLRGTQWGIWGGEKAKAFSECTRREEEEEKKKELEEEKKEENEEEEEEEELFWSVEICYKMRWDP